VLWYPTQAKGRLEWGTQPSLVSNPKKSRPLRMMILWENQKRNRRSLHYATPDFLSRLVALANFMRLSLRKAAHAAVSRAAWQKIRVRSGRDDQFV
jgi:hypothetical protein